jgi:plastocyanin
VALLLACPSPSRAAEGPAVEGTVTVLDRNGTPKPQHNGVVVFLDELEHPAAPVPTAHAVITQKNKTFDPEVLPIVAGTTVDFPNNDTIYHNVFSLSKTKPFDLGLYEQGASQAVTFDQPGLVKVYCNIHPNMVAYILVLANPYFATTDAQGHFTIRDAPLGAATVRSWYPRSREQPERKIVVSAQGVQNLNFSMLENLRLEIREENVSIQHKNKFGQDYPAKY